MGNAVATDTLKALIVDPDAKRVNTLVDALKNCGYAPVTAEDEMSARMLVDSEKFDVVLCYDKVANGTVLDVQKSLKEAAPDLPLIVISDDPKSPLIAEALNAGAIDSYATSENLAALYPKLAAIQTQQEQKHDHAAHAHAHAAPAAPATTIHPVRLPQLGESTSKNEPANVDLIMDVPVAVNAILGNTTMKIAELLQLGPGSVIELDKRAGEPVDIFVNDKLIAFGEVVVVNETFGVRITEVIDPKQRIQALA